MQQLELRVSLINNRRRQVRGWVLVIGAALLLCGGARFVAAAEASPEDANKVVAAGAAGTNVAAIPLAEVAAQAEAAFASLQSIEGNLSADQATAGDSAGPAGADAGVERAPGREFEDAWVQSLAGKRCAG